MCNILHFCLKIYNTVSLHYQLKKLSYKRFCNNFRTMLCPDTMFYTRQNELQLVGKEELRPIADKYNLKRLVLQNGDALDF